MSEKSSSEMTRRELLRTVAGAAVAGAAGVGISPARAQQSPAKEPVEVIFSRTRPLDHPTCAYPGFEPGVRVENGMRIERDVAVKMRDGVTIYTDIYRPDGATNVPAIIAWGSGKHPQDRVRRGVPQGEGYGLYTVSKYAKGEAPDPAYWCKHGYAVINPDTRGSYKSEGKGYVWGGKVEGRDCYDMIEWLATRDWSNGKVGMSGNSQLAIWQWFAAAERPPHLAAISPWEGWTDMYRQLICPGGIPETGFSGRQYVLGRCGSGGMDHEDIVAMLHKYPLMNEYWEGKIPRLENINVPAYITSNFKHFHALGSFEAFRRIPVRDKWLRVINTFEWPDYYEPAIMDDLRRFFDRYLKDIKNDWELTPRVRLSVLNPGGLDLLNRPENEWPLARTQYEKLYLDAATKTLSTQPLPRESQARYNSDDVRHDWEVTATTRPWQPPDTGHVNFTVRFDRDTELTGYLKLRLWVEADGADDMDLFVYVQKLDRRGEFLPSMVMGFPHPGAQGWLRVSHRELDPARSTTSEPYLTHRRQQFLRPKEIVPVEIGIWPTSMLWHAGQQLRLVVAGHFRRDQIGLDQRGWWETFRYEVHNRGDHVIHTGGKYDSHLLVPRIPL